MSTYIYIYIKRERERERERERDWVLIVALGQVLKGSGNNEGQD